MQKNNFKIGDKVEILPYATSVGVESEDVGKVGVINYMNDVASERFGIAVQMKEICKARGYIPNWSVGYKMIKLVPTKGEQLLLFSL